MKTACVYHSIDLDGWMSAAIVKKWFNEENNGFNTVPQNNNIDFIGFNYGQTIPNLSEFDSVIMCDISFPKEEMAKFYHNIDREFIWIDHHISAINDNNDLVYKGIRDTKFAACELTWKYFFTNEPMPELVRLLGRYDSFGHKGTSEEQTVLEFQYGSRSLIQNYEDAFEYLNKSISTEGIKNALEDKIHEMGIGIYQFLRVEAKQSYKNGFEIFFNETIPLESYKDNPVKRKFICINKERFNPINFGIDYHAEGYDGAACFHYAKGKWNFSLYNDNGLVDCSVICKSLGGGGHKGAAGFVTDDIHSIILKP